MNGSTPSAARSLRDALLSLLVVTCASIAMAQTDSALPVVQPNPNQDDATLHDIQFVGTRLGWAVGDRGVIWHTQDAGQSWQLIPSGVDCSLYSVCFLTNDIGWIVGGRTAAYAGTTEGVILFTANGGRSWQYLGQRRLPRLRHVQFFSLEEGIVIGESDHEFPTGILETRDGGQSWQPIPGRPHKGWRAADFIELDAGVVAGDRGQLTVVGDGALLAPQYDRPDARSLRDVTVGSDFSGWLVGDGGLVLKTDSGGVSWSNPPRDLPRELSGFFDFRAVERRGDQVWIAGSPGSAIWNSTDQGHSWRALPTGSQVPINSIEFVSDEIGWACGELGTILQTRDGGASWFPVRGAERRVAILAFSPRPDRLPLQLVAAESADLGYRAAVVLPSDPGAHESLQQPDPDDRIHDGIVAAGGNSANIDWRFPLTRPDSDRDMTQLIEQWQTMHEGNVAQVFLGSIVSQLRTWRPTIVVVDGAYRNDAVARVIEQAVLQAVKDARDPLRFPEQQSLGGLQPWSVRKVFRRLSDGSQGRVVYDPDRLLTRVGKPLRIPVASAQSILGENRVVAAEAYELLYESGSGGHQQSVGGNLFAGAPISPDSAARRPLLNWDDELAEQRERLAARQRNVRAIAQRMMNDTRQAGQMIGQLRELSRGLSNEEAAWQLADIANQYKEQARWELVESTLIELVSLYPDEPVALDAMLWLFRFWSSTETAWQRNRRTEVGSDQLVVNQEEIRQRISNAVRQASTRPLDRGNVNFAGGPGVDVNRRTGALDARQIDSSAFAEGESASVRRVAEWRRGSVAHWLSQAGQMAGLIRDRQRGFEHNPEFLFAQAALLRERGTYRASDEIYRQFFVEHEASRWRAIAAGEHWLLQPTGLPPNELAGSGLATSGPPHLDGVLGDPCWVDARPIRLTHSSQAAVAPQGAIGEPLIYVSYDEQYLYLAGSIPRRPGQPVESPQHAGRTYDADLNGSDRVRIELDVDRDYAVWYRFEIDQRGWTRESCWEDLSWNPRYHVAGGGDADRWTFEMAIPFEELVPSAPRDKTVWAVGLSRLAPGDTVQSWNLPAVAEPRPESFGLLQFRGETPQPVR